MAPGSCWSKTMIISRLWWRKESLLLIWLISLGKTKWRSFLNWISITMKEWWTLCLSLLWQFLRTKKIRDLIRSLMLWSLWNMNFRAKFRWAMSMKIRRAYWKSSKKTSIEIWQCILCCFRLLISMAKDNIISCKNRSTPKWYWITSKN